MAKRMNGRAFGVLAGAVCALATSGCAQDPPVDSVQTDHPAIHATFSPTTFSTTYTLTVHSTISEAITITWSGTNCGVTTPNDPPTTGTDATSSMTWTHAHPPCDPTTDHKNVTVTATVTSTHLHYTCVYQGADTGLGAECTKT